MRRSTIAPTLLAALLVVVPLAAGCTADTPSDSVTAGATASAGATADGGPADEVAPGGFNGTDLAWLQLMIPMNERTLPLLELAAARGDDPAVRRLATEVHAAHLAELVRLRELLTETGLDARNPHEGHDMPGMVTAVQLDALRAATGPDFDRLFRDRLREHLDQSARVSTSEQQSGTNPATRTLAAQITQTRHTQLDHLARSA